MLNQLVLLIKRHDLWEFTSKVYRGSFQRTDWSSGTKIEKRQNLQITNLKIMISNADNQVVIGISYHALLQWFIVNEASAIDDFVQKKTTKHDTNKEANFKFY